MALLHDLSGKRDCNSCGSVNKKLEGEEKRKTFKNTTDAVKALSNGDGKTVDAAMRHIMKSKDFRRSDECKDIFVTQGFENDQDGPSLMQAAKKAVEHNNKVWILPNPEGARTPDYLFQKGQSIRVYDLKRITGTGSVGTDLNNAKGQSRRFVLDITSNYSPRLLISEIKKAFENDNELTEVLIYKGKKEIVINRNYFTNRNVIKDFIRDWAK